MQRCSKKALHCPFSVSQMSEIVGYHMIIGGHLSDTSSSTYVTNEVDVIDILSDTTSCTAPKDFNFYGLHFLCLIWGAFPFKLRKKKNVVAS